MSPRVEILVVDTTAFIKNAALHVSTSRICLTFNKVFTEEIQIQKVMCLLLQELGTQITTVQEVVNEITSKRQIRRLVVLPYDLKIKTVFQENIQYSEYSRWHCQRRH
jgi:hypothetical protein